MRFRKPTFLVIWLLLVLPVAPCWSQGTPTVTEIRALIGGLAETRELNVTGAKIGATEFVLDFYNARQFSPAWTDPENATVLLQGIQKSAEHGLNPADFHADTLQALVSSADKAPRVQAKLDILLTDAAARLLGQLFYGKVDPNSVNADWNLDRPFVAGNPIDIIQAALTNNQLGDLISRSEVKHPDYLGLKAALRSYREIAASGGWPMVPEGEVLKLGMSDPRVPKLRVRLARSGDFAGVADYDELTYDEDLVAAVVAFQTRHALDPDGVVGPATLAALNVSVDQRIDQIRVNLERARWVLRDLGADFIIVNIAGFYVHVMRNNEEIWETSVIVGKSYHQTPIFRDSMSYLDLNPTWTVPPGILRREIVPKAKKNPSYLSRANLELFDASGQKIDPDSIDWKAANPKAFPYRVVQRPGPGNALGQVKFMFPNKHAVYLHDTPQRNLFEKTERAFSHGCIRVENPLKLAELLLADQPQWTREKIDEVLASGKTTTVRLSRKLPVLLLYWTVDPDSSGDVRFYSDVYDRDRALLEALDQPHPAS